MASNDSKLDDTIGRDAQEGTAIQRCVREELQRYFDLLEGQPPHELYRLVIDQVEAELLRVVMAEARNNQSRASQWLGISRGTLRGKLAQHGCSKQDLKSDS